VSKFLGSRESIPFFSISFGSQVFSGFLVGFEAHKNPEKTIQIKNPKKANSYQVSFFCSMPNSSGFFLYSYLAVWTILSIFSLHRLFLVYLYHRHKDNARDSGSRFKSLPRVAIQLPIFNETEVVERLLCSVSAIHYPKDLLEIQVLDDSTNECRFITAKIVEDLRSAGIPIRHITRSERIGFKAGALRNGMRETKGEFLFILDSDFIPPPDILLRTIHYFADEKIGCVQMRWDHVNRDFSILTRVQAMLLDGHFAIEQAARNRSGRFFNFNGTAGIWRKRCIEEAGGWHDDTLTEDLDLSYRAQLAGWKFLFLPHISIPGELPVQAGAFKIQQRRWAKGSIQTLRKLFKRIWVSPIPLKAKVEASFHLSMNCSYPLILFLTLLLFPAIFRQVEFTLFSFSVNSSALDYPLYFVATMSFAIFYLSSQAAVDRGLLRALIGLPLLLAVGVGISLSNSLGVLEGFYLKTGEFKRTPKRNVLGKERAADWRKVLTVFSPLSFMELALGAYFLFLIRRAFFLDRIAIIPFLFIFYFGFAFMGLNSLFQIERRDF
jgi:cellulose synthase/poly-beta-1,6-N-acetylglucosamine synthase-like glycosyltransferase